MSASANPFVAKPECIQKRLHGSDAVCQCGCRATGTRLAALREAAELRPASPRFGLAALCLRSVLDDLSAASST